MNSSVTNSLEFTPQEYAYFRAELFKRVTPWEKRSLFFGDFAVEDCSTSLRFWRNNGRRPNWRWQVISDVQVARTSSYVCIHWTKPEAPRWMKYRWAIFFCSLAFIALVVFVRTRSLPEFGILPILVCVAVAAVLLLGGFASEQYQREENQRNLDTLFSECARDARSQCVVAEEHSVK